MTTETVGATDEAQIRALIDDWASALRAKDINRLIASYAPDVLTFDVVNPLQRKGLDAARKRAQEWISSWQGPIECEIRELTITTGDDVAFSHNLSHFNGRQMDGGEIDMWIRATLCYRKVDGRWNVTHEHVSVPFDPESGQASLDLKP
jgi:uncharacterized protein (TIGR02246 family)